MAEVDRWIAVVARWRSIFLRLAPWWEAAPPPPGNAAHGVVVWW